MKVKDGELFSSEKFHLYNSEGELEEHEGLYFICDGGYHKWRCLQCPMKHKSDLASAHFSTCLESVRKDVECVFGILKKRFRILKNAVKLHNQKKIDNVFFTCCILHNILHHYDGYELQKDGSGWGKQVARRFVQSYRSTSKPTTNVLFSTNRSPSERNSSFLVITASKIFDRKFFSSFLFEKRQIKTLEKYRDY